MLLHLCLNKTSNGELPFKAKCVCFLVSCDLRSDRRVMESSVFCHPSVLKWIPSLNVPATSIMNWKGSILLTFLLCVKMSSQDQELKDQVCFFICKAVKLMEQNIKWVVKLYNNNKLVTTMTHWHNTTYPEKIPETLSVYLPRNSYINTVCPQTRQSRILGSHSLIK